MRSRSQSTVIGFVLVVAILIMLLLVLQTTAVPAWNQGVEFSHNERVQGEMEQVRDGVTRTAATGNGGSASVSLGTQYPVRPFLFNPANPSGEIRTTSSRTVTIANATAAGETGDYWNGTVREFTDRGLVYEPRYNEYRNAPTTVFENSVLYNRFGERTLPVTSQNLVSDRRLTLVTLNGSLSKNGQRSHSVDFDALSAPTQVTPVESDGPLVVTTATQLSQETWTELLAEERVEAGGYVTNVSVTAGDPNVLRLTLAAGESYDLRMSKVGVGSNLDDPPASYITTDSPAELQLVSGTAERFTFEVRDRYNNPVSGVEVNTSVAGPGTLTPVDNVTDADGHAVFRYEAGGTGSETVTATFGTDADAMRTATIAVESRSGETSGGDDVGPAVTDIDTNETTATDRTVQRGTPLDISATVSDFERGGSDIYRASWSSNRTAPSGSAPMQPESGDDDEFDSVEETVIDRNVDTSDWETGWHNITVTGTDANGNVGANHYRVQITDATAADNTNYVGGTAATTDGGNEFGIGISVQGTVTLQSASVDTSTMLGGVRDGLGQIQVDGTNVRSASGSYASDGTQESLDPQRLSGSHTIEFRNFNRGNNNENLEVGSYQYQASQPAGAHIAVALEFDDGSTARLYFTPP